ncbi:MAG: molybdopterin-dependent oxidoreductase [Slackia sp.]|nr:molybdopterin-dependent oxidoreductase [Slackia sp.]
MGNMKPKGWAAARLAVLLAVASGLCIFALMGCQPSSSTHEEESDQVADTSAETEDMAPGNFMNLDAGAWGDTQYAQAVNAGNRGCNSCHFDLFPVLPKGENSKGLHEVDAEPAYGKVYTWNDCTTCHVHSPGTGSALGGCGPYMAPSIHGFHFANEEFRGKGGNCFSCHEVDVETGELGMWDELKYTKMIGIGNTAPAEKFDTWITGRGYETGTVTGGVIEHDIALENTSLSQDVSGPDDLFSATNMDYPDLNEDNYEFTLKGVVNEKTYTLEDLRAMPQTEVTFTKMCMTNGGNGGWFVANIPAKGVLISDLIEDCGGLLDSSIAYSYWGYDGWCGSTTPDLSEFPLDYMDPNAMIALEFWGEPIKYMDGGPASFIQPGAPATTMSKWVKEVVFHEGVNLNPDRTYTKVTFPGIWAGWFNPAKDGQEVKVGETITLSGYAWALPEQGKNKTTSVEISADYGETWTSIEVPEDFDRDQWVLWSADWTPEVAGTYCLTVHAGSELADNPSNDGSIIITVVE